MTNALIGNKFHRSQTKKTDKMQKRAPGIAAAYLFLRSKDLVLRYLVQQHGKGAQKTVFVKIMGPPGIAITRQQIKGVFRSHGLHPPLEQSVSYVSISTITGLSVSTTYWKSKKMLRITVN